jgi:hypothetical protein
VAIWRICGFLLGWLTCMVCQAQASNATNSIYTCVDAKGRRITSDRPIMDCLDREQTELNPSGSTRRRVGPTLTAREQVVEDEKAKKQAEDQARLSEQKRRDRALLTRYPNKATHDQERLLALAQIDELVSTSHQRTAQLQVQRKGYIAELEFYNGDINKAPPALRRQLEDVDASMLTQRRYVLDQESEKKRVNLRFEQELAKLRQLWAMMAVPVDTSTSGSRTK